MRSREHPQENDRLAFLDRLEVIDSESEQIFEDFVELAAAICEVPIALVSLIERDRQWFKAKVGLDLCETSREVSFCSHAILEEGPLVVTDATLDPRFADNPLVTGDFHLRFYAGIPVSVNGYPMGTICVIDHWPRTLTESQLGSLVVLGRQMSACLESRLNEKRLRETTEKLQRTESTLFLAKRRFEELFENLAVASYTTDLNGLIYDFNRESEELFGFEAFEVMGKCDIELLVAESDRTMALEMLGRVQAGESIRNVERRMVTVQGNPIWTILNIHPVTDPTGGVTGAILAYQDITARKTVESELEEANSSLEVLANKDGLTGIANRRSIAEFLSTEAKSASRHCVTVILLDVDDFKGYNDSYGHPAGDDVLKEIADILSTHCRPSDRVGRFGGEEFLVVLPHTDSEKGSQVAERLRAAIESHAWPHRRVTASFGVATSSLVTNDADKLVSLADVRLYAAKKQGRNCVVGASSESMLGA